MISKVESPRNPKIFMLLEKKLIKEIGKTRAAKDQYRRGYNFSQWEVKQIGTLKHSLTPSLYIYM